MATRSLGGVGHGAHPPPQLAREVSLAQPEPQRWKPALHTKPQAVPSQNAAPLGGGAGHAAQSAPQVAVAVFETHAPLQLCCVDAQVIARHAPLTHSVPAAHAVPQRPQLRRSARVLVQPLEHRERGVGQAHAPETQAVAAPQSAPHAPQLYLFEERFTQPKRGHVTVPVGHRHAPPAHT